MAVSVSVCRRDRLGADYTQYSHRMLYDWREPSAVDYFVNDVLLDIGGWNATLTWK